MAKRGRKSAAPLEVSTSPSMNKPIPPDDLSEIQRDIWITTVGSLPSGWFPPETWEMLAAYCRHADTSAVISTKILKTFNSEDGTVEFLDNLFKMRDRETRAMLACARALRITKQARQEPKTAARQASGGSASAYDVLEF